MVDLIKLCMDGCVLTLGNGDPARFVDFFIAGNDGRVLVMSAGWWVDGFGRGGGVVLLEGTVTPGDASAAYVSPGAPPYLTGTFGTPDDDAERRALASHRLATDCQRGRYDAALAVLSDDLAGTPAAPAEFDLTPWLSAVKARPAIDPVAYAAAKASREREIGTLYMNAADGGRVGAVAIDEDGRAAVAGGDAWLASLADAYAGMRGPRPDVADYVNWMAGQTPHGPASLSNPRAARMSGTVEDVAAGMMAQTSAVP